MAVQKEISENTEYLSGVKIPKNLPTVRKGPNGLSKANKIKLAKIICEVYSKDEYTIATVLNYFSIKHTRTWLDWANEHPEIRQMYEDAKDEKNKRYKLKVTERAKTGLERKLEGYTVNLKTIKRRVAKPDEKKAGPDIILVEETIVTERYIPPSDKLIEFVLTNHEAGEYQKNPIPEEKPDEKVDIPITSWVD